MIIQRTKNKEQGRIEEVHTKARRHEGTQGRGEREKREQRTEKK